MKSRIKILFVLLCILLILNLLLILDMKNKEKKVIIKRMGLQKGEMIIYTNGVKEYVLFRNVTTGSMYPFIKNNTCIYSRDITNNTKLDIGDVIIYMYPDGRFIQHRIIKKISINNKTYYQLKGDNNEYPDKYLVPREVIIRKITGVKYENC